MTVKVCISLKERTKLKIQKHAKLTEKPFYFSCKIQLYFSFQLRVYRETKLNNMKKWLGTVIFL